MKQKRAASRPYEDGLSQRLKDPKFAIEYLNSILEDDDPNLLLLGLRDVAIAYGFSKLADLAGLNRENLYKALSKGKNPRIGTIMDVFSAIGCRLRLEPRIKKLKQATN